MLPIIVGVVVGIVVAVGVVLGVLYYKFKVAAAAAGTATGGEGDMVDVPKSDGIMIESVDLNK